MGRGRRNQHQTHPSYLPTWKACRKVIRALLPPAIFCLYLLPHSGLFLVITLPCFFWSCCLIIHGKRLGSLNHLFCHPSEPHWYFGDWQATLRSRSYVHRKSEGPSVWYCLPNNTHPLPNFSRSPELRAGAAGHTRGPRPERAHRLAIV